MSKEQVRELITQQRINWKIAKNWIYVIINGNLNQNWIKKCYMNTMTELCMISSLDTTLLDWQN
jgi:hypothetical protein